MIRFFAPCLVLLVASLAQAAGQTTSSSGNATSKTTAQAASSSGKGPSQKNLPYLGPGSDKLSKEAYERIYKTYIQTSILLGYPFLEGEPQACDQALSTIFRQAGMFSYPVPVEAQQVVRSSKLLAGKKLEVYEMGGMLVQLLRLSSGAPERLVWINSGATKATSRLVKEARKSVLTLEKDPVTSLERVKGVPVGYPHMFLSASGQGLLVKVLKFNGKKDDCQPADFFDNSWQVGFDLTNDRCLELETDAARVWTNAMKPEEFRERELKRLKEKAKKNAMAQGASEAEALRLVEKHFVPPYTSEINVVGSAMRNLAQCKVLALGHKAPAAGSGETDQPSLNAPDAGSGK